MIVYTVAVEDLGLTVMICVPDITSFLGYNLPNVGFCLNTFLLVRNETFKNTQKRRTLIPALWEVSTNLTLTLF